MQIQINENVFLENDGRNIAVKRRIFRKQRDTTKEPNEYFDYAYYGSLESALTHGVLNKGILTSDDQVNSILELRAYVAQIKKDILYAINQSELVKFMEVREEAKPLPAPVFPAKKIRKARKA